MWQCWRPSRAQPSALVRSRACPESRWVWVCVCVCVWCVCVCSGYPQCSAIHIEQFLWCLILESWSVCC
jgi:hypothetical protein